MDKIISFEVDPQFDFMNKANARLYINGSEEIRPNIKRLAQHFEDRCIHRILTRDRHFKDDNELQENGGIFPRHCMDRSESEASNGDGTFGIDFVPEVNQNEINTRITRYSRYDRTELNQIVKQSFSIVIEKDTYSVFDNPNTLPILRILRPSAAIVFGVATDYCVHQTVRGLRKAEIKTIVIEDAIAGVTEEGTTDAIKTMQKAGAIFMNTGEFLCSEA
jgi:nicotinamidase/pyrazinamidase